MAEILLVDDDPVLRNSLSDVLRRQGYDVRTASDGAAAVATFAERRPDLVLMDVMMPVMDGFTACKSIVGLDRDVPVVFLTAKDDDADVVRGLEVGADDFVSKLESDEVLLARIRKALSRAAGRREIPIPSNLTKAQCDLYRLLRASPGRLFSYVEIANAICGSAGKIGEDTVRSHVKNLRRKLPDGERILVKRGFGYGLGV